MPAGALVMPTGGFTTRGHLKCVKPTDDDMTGLVVVGRWAITSKAAGVGSFEPRCQVCFDPEGDTPAQGDTLGSTAGSWFATVGGKGFRAFGGAAGAWADCIRADIDTASAGGTVTTDFEPLGSTYTIAADDTYENTPLTISIPAGKYIAWGHCSAQLQLSAISSAAAKIIWYVYYDDGAGHAGNAVIGGIAVSARSTGSPSYFGSGFNMSGELNFPWAVTLSLRVRCVANGATVTARQIMTSVDGFSIGTKIGYIKIG